MTKKARKGTKRAKARGDVRGAGDRSVFFQLRISANVLRQAHAKLAPHGVTLSWVVRKHIFQVATGDAAKLLGPVDPRQLVLPRVK